eukprot:9626517-Ditylum_brightwellii.AAC.1
MPDITLSKGVSLLRQRFWGWFVFWMIVPRSGGLAGAGVGLGDDVGNRRCGFGLVGRKQCARMDGRVMRNDPLLIASMSCWNAMILGSS